MLFYKWVMGPTCRSLLFAGIPVVLAANFMIGGSRILDAFGLDGMKQVMAYGFFGQLFWMFGGLALLIYLGKSNHVRNLAPGMAGSLVAFGTYRRLHGGRPGHRSRRPRSDHDKCSFLRSHFRFYHSGNERRGRASSAYTCPALTRFRCGNSHYGMVAFYAETCCLAGIRGGQGSYAVLVRLADHGRFRRFRSSAS
jgi:hypothetical protein